MNGQDTVVITPTLAVSTSIYAALDIVGGKLTLSEAMRTKDGGGILQSITVVDDDNEKADLYILLFDSDPAGTTTDNGAWTPAAGNPAKVLHRIDVLSSDYVTLVTSSLAVASIKNLGLPVEASGGSSLYALIFAVGTPTYTATTDLTVRFGFLRD